VLNTEELGDCKPTQLLHRLQQLAGDTPGFNDGSLIRELFLQRLPSNVRMVLASTWDNTPIKELAQLADKIIKVAAPTVSNVNRQPPATELDLLCAEITSLKQMIQLMKLSSHPRTHQSPSPTNKQPSTTAVCWYHQKFGDSASKCKPPCSKSGNEQASH